MRGQSNSQVKVAGSSPSGALASLAANANVIFKFNRHGPKIRVRLHFLQILFDELQRHRPFADSRKFKHQSISSGCERAGGGNSRSNSAS